jgi:hypothetical protein
LRVREFSSHRAHVRSNAPCACTRTHEDLLRHASASSNAAWREAEQEEKLWQWKGFDDFVELGPGKTLSGFVRQIGTELQATYTSLPLTLVRCSHISVVVVSRRGCGGRPVDTQKHRHRARGHRVLQELSRVNKSSSLPRQDFRSFFNNLRRKYWKVFFFSFLSFLSSNLFRLVHSINGQPYLVCEGVAGSLGPGADNNKRCRGERHMKAETAERTASWWR